MKKWSIWIHHETLIGKLKEKLLGNYIYKECDELAHGPPGFFELIYNENAADYIWMRDVETWRCNFGHKETSEEIRKNAMQTQIDQLTNMTNQQQFIAPDIYTSDTQTTQIKEEAMFG